MSGHDPDGAVRNLATLREIRAGRDVDPIAWRRAMDAAVRAHERIVAAQEARDAVRRETTTRAAHE